MKNKLNEEQQKRFNEKFRTGAENNLEMYDDSLGANCFSNAGIAPLARYLADEIARAREDSARGFLDYMNDKELWNSHWDKVEIISRVEDYVKKLKE